MFAKTIIDSDAFIDMSASAQALYFHLAMRADDDGFVNAPKKIQRMVNASDDDLKILIAKRFLIPFDSGVVVIKHWKIHNYIQGDRYKPTVYTEEKSLLDVKPNKAYTLNVSAMDTGCIQDVSKTETQVRLGKVRIDKESKGKDKRYRAESEPDSAPAVITIPLNDGSEYAVKQDDFNEWLTLYPAVDIMQELRKMRGWSQVNGSKRKTRKGIKRFIVNWLAREQDKPHAESQRKTGNDGNPFLRMLQESEANDGKGNTEDSISFEGGIPDVLPGFEGR